MGHDVAAGGIQLREHPDRPQPAAHVGPARARPGRPAAGGRRPRARRRTQHPAHQPGRRRARGGGAHAPRVAVAATADHGAGGHLRRAGHPIVGGLGGGSRGGVGQRGRLVLASRRDTGDMTEVALAPTMPTGQPGEQLPTVGSGTLNFGWWGMVLFIAVEATVFAVLLASYFYVRFRSGPVWPPDGIE